LIFAWAAFCTFGLPLHRFSAGFHAIFFLEIWTMSGSFHLLMKCDQVLSREADPFFIGFSMSKCLYCKTLPKAWKTTPSMVAPDNGLATNK
jgi:hypothetical protein